MRERDRLAQQRYLHDPIFHNLVTMLTKLMVDTNLDPNIVHDAVNLAADMRYHAELKGDKL